ncbi:hypothetical protein Tco_1483050 [Tanacetum coccineum]
MESIPKERNVDYAFLPWEDFTYQVENKNTKKGNVMYYPCFTKLILYGAILPKELTNEDIQNFESYKEYHAIASGKVLPKTKASVHKKKADSDTTPKEKPPTDPKDKRVKQTDSLPREVNSNTPISQESAQVMELTILSKVPDEQVHGEGHEESWTFSDGDDDDDANKDSDAHNDDDEDDDANKDSDAHDDDDDDDDATKSDDDGENITHPKLSTFLTDDQEEKNDEEEREEDDEDEEEISAHLVRTPSDYQTSDESEKQKDDDRVKDGEEDKEGDITNVNLEGGDVDMTEADTTKDTKDAHVVIPRQGGNTRRNVMNIITTQWCQQ